ncbi:MAG: long-chain acyl-CoA synthetase [Enterobacterales bacterium]|jgi:long-chain acyl-CoA synthetase
MFSLTQIIRRASQINSDGIATHDGERRQTWNQLIDKVGRFAGGLRRLSLGDGDCAAILALNSDRYFEFMFSVPWAGGIFQPINTRLAGPEIIYWLNDSDAKILFVDSSFAPLISTIKSQLTQVKYFVFIDEGELPGGYTSYSDLIDCDPIEDRGRHGDDVAGLFYTGGTTGRSKGVMLSHSNLAMNALQCLSTQEFRRADRFLHVAPMFHIADAIFCMMTATVAGANYFKPGFEPLSTLAAIEEYKIERILLVPTMISMTVNHPDIDTFDLTSLKTLIYGASPMPESVIKKTIDVLPDTELNQAYGQTETSPIITILLPERHVFDGPLAGKTKSAGQSVPGIDLAIMDEQCQPVAAGVVGEICMRGPNMMVGYHNMIEQTEKTIVEGWLHTGDGGYLDEDGFLFIVDRVKDMIISGGENVYSAEVENAIYQQAAVSQCAVIGIPHDNWGEQVHAIVVLHEAQSLSEEQLIEHCKSLIAGFKCPRSVAFQTEPLPLSGAGKILKTELRKPYWSDSERNIN